MVQESPPKGFEPYNRRQSAQPDGSAPTERTGEEEVAPLIGDRYALLEQIGEGGAARVFRAHDRVLDRIVAVKVLRTEHGRDQDFVARFFREARAVASLSHPNIVDIYDYGTDKASNFIVMQYIEGTDLKALLQREGRLTPARAVAIASGALRGLGAAHERGLIHRDVKPQNLLVRASDGLVKLTDFGVARALGGPQHTAEGLTFGTAHYMAPEQATGGQIGPAADLYSVGVVLFEALSGRLPFDAETALAVTAQHVHAPLPSLASIVPEVPAALARVVERALAKDPAARYPSAEALRRALTAAVGDSRVGVAARPAPRAAATAQTAILPVAGKPAAALPARGGAAGDRVRPTFRGGYGCLFVLLGALIVGLTLGLFAVTRGMFDGDDPPTTPIAGNAPGSSGAGVALSEPTPTRPVSTATTPPSAAAVPPVAATTAPSPTATVAPPTATAAPPTATAVPPTATAVPPTATAVPPTPTPVPPTPTPVPPTPTSPPPPPATRPPEAVLPREPFSPYQLTGAYRRDDGVLYGLPVVALYGQGSGYNEGTAAFQLAGRPGGAVRLILTGLDDERNERCRLEVIINGRTIFDGATTFPNTPTTDNGVGGQARYWGQMAITVPADVLREGRNTITLRNRTPGSQPGIPYILIHDLEFAAP